MAVLTIKETLKRHRNSEQGHGDGKSWCTVLWVEKNMCKLDNTDI